MSELVAGENNPSLLPSSQRNSLAHNRPPKICNRPSRFFNAASWQDFAARRTTWLHGYLQNPCWCFSMRCGHRRTGLSGATSHLAKLVASVGHPGSAPRVPACLILVRALLEQLQQELSTRRVRWARLERRLQVPWKRQVRPQVQAVPQTLHQALHQPRTRRMLG